MWLKNVVSVETQNFKNKVKKCVTVQINKNQFTGIKKWLFINGIIITLPAL